MIRKAILFAALLLPCSCTHARAVRFPDESGDKDTVWICAPDAQHPGDVACLDMNELLQKHPELRPCGRRPSDSSL